ncbi:MAG: hypothetical protein R2845_02965 [Thermomicrobiales bacterium]
MPSRALPGIGASIRMLWRGERQGEIVLQFGDALDLGPAPGSEGESGDGRSRIDLAYPGIDLEVRERGFSIRRALSSSASESGITES